MKRLLPCLHYSTADHRWAARWAVLGMQVLRSHVALRECRLVQPERQRLHQAPQGCALCCCCNLSGRDCSLARSASHAAAQTGESASYAALQGLLAFLALSPPLAILLRMLAAWGYSFELAALTCPSAGARAAGSQADEALLGNLCLLPD